MKSLTIDELTTMKEKEEKNVVFVDKRGQKIYAEADAVGINAYKKQMHGNTNSGLTQEQIDGIVFNPDGTIGDIVNGAGAISIDRLMLNRFYKGETEDGEPYLAVVTGGDGYIACKEQSSGRISYPLLNAYVIVRKKSGKNKGKLEVLKTITITDEEFMSKFTNALSHDAMWEVLEAIRNMGGMTDEKSLDELGI